MNPNMNDTNSAEAHQRMLEESPDNNSIKMKDKYYMTYILFYALGTLTLVPNNFFTTATDYWMYKFRDPNNETWDNENRTGLQAEFVSDFSIVSSVSNIVFLVVTIFLSKKIGMVPRLIGALTSTILWFTITVIFVEIDTDSWQMGFFVLTLITGSLLTASGSVFMVTLFELATKFPPHYLASILSGQSICGIFAALVQIFSLSIGAKSTTTGLVYFLIGMFFVFFTLVLFFFNLLKSDLFKHNLRKEVEQREKPKITKELVFTILGKLKYYLLSMIIVLGCSIMIHPAVTSLVLSMDKGKGNKWNDVFFVPVATFLLYNVLDFIGRELAGKIKRPQNGLIIFLISVLRIAFVPMLMLCNAQPRHHLPVVFDKDFAFIIFIIIFGLTNGYLVNLCVIQVPRVTTAEEKGVALTLIVVFMIVSLGTCSFLSALMVKAL